VSPVVTINFANISLEASQAAIAAIMAHVQAPAAGAPAPTREAMDEAIHKAEVAHAEAPKSPKPSKAKPVVPVATQPAPEASTPTATAPAEPVQESPSEAIEYAVVQKAITDKVKTDRDAAVAVLTKFGVKRGTELKPEQYADFLAELA
jgi:hypothetical protein